ncbi:membrane-associated eicosanoid glutathione metabolism protein [Diplodia corticola]|uniref:Membrane-associated eicosanoid glutathione metabolism protein n=1 Tax=Diplodia corticola TaxID=236234 RepID=A0A1J9S6V9_9PEZI|nr:membrane-associated eicosanoid glutathione metabolism protein [Diplodia corticola]OJD36255.1 membrane-associated eicosanoid glutathione metabolism protein [Diplodia corticola]
MPHYAILSIPAMWLVSLYPHAHAVGLIKSANNNRWDNANSKGHAWSATMQQSVPADVLARFERAEAAHRNGFENLPLFGLAVLSAEWAAVPEATVAVTAWTYVALRVAYNALYLNTTDVKTSFARSGVWALSSLVGLSLFVRAALQ